MAIKNTENIKFVCVTIISIIFCIGIYIWAYRSSNNTDYSSNNNIDSSETSIITKIDSLESKIDSIKDSRIKIKTIISSDTVHLKIIHEEYTKTINTIIHQPASADYNDITEYIEHYARQHDSINPKTSKNN